MTLGFAGSRAQTVRVLELLGASRCGYTWTRDPNADLVALWHGTRCDCKAGGPDPHSPRSVPIETTGCPELRTAVAVLHQLTDAEFDERVVRAGGIRLPQLNHEGGPTMTVTQNQETARVAARAHIGVDVPADLSPAEAAGFAKARVVAALEAEGSVVSVEFETVEVAFER